MINQNPIRSLLASLLLILPLLAQAQVAGINYSIAPGASYTWFNNRAGLDRTFMVGGRLGIGFGEFVELRGLYYQNLDGTIDFGAFDVDTDELDNTDVDLARYGAELKLNLSRGGLLPYLLVGGGIQDIGREGLDESKNLYGTAGLGLTLAANNRFNFSLEGQYLAYRFNAVRDLLSQAERDFNDLDLEETNFTDLGNWTVGANLAFYLGGREPGTLSDIDRAYLNAFGNGFSGLRIPLEVTAAHVDFDESLNYRDTWLGGVNLGVDFGPFIGLRAYYLQAMDDGEFNFDFDDLAMYGADLRLNLSRTGLGVTPFLTLGGGRINVQDGYQGREGATASSQGFANGGVGLSLNIGRSLRLNGSYKALITSSTDEFGEISTTDDLVTSNMFTVGLNLALGNTADPQEEVDERIQRRLDEQEAEYEARMSGLEDKYENRLESQEDKYKSRLNSQEEEYESRLEDREEKYSNRMQDRRQAMNRQEERYQARIDSINAENDRQARRLKQRYQERIADLESQLNDAYTQEDVDRAAELLEEKEVAEEIIAEIERREDRQRDAELRSRRSAMDEIRYYYPMPEDRYEMRRERRSYRSMDRDVDVEYRSEEGDNREMRNRRSGDNQIRMSVDQLIRLLEARPATTAIDTAMMQQMRQNYNAAANRSAEAEALREKMNQNNQRLIQEIDRLQEQMANMRRNRDTETDTTRREQYQELLQSLEGLESAMGNMETDMQAYPSNITNGSTDTRREQFEYQAEMRRQFNRLNDQLADQNARLAQLERPNQPTNVTVKVPENNRTETERNTAAGSTTNTVIPRTELPITTTGDYILDESASSGFGRTIKYAGMSGFAGLNLGDNSNNTFNLGLRWHYTVGERERFELMPEAFFGFGTPSNFGLSMNGLYPIELDNTFVQPYVGAGFGFMQLTDQDSDADNATKLRPVFNLLIGTYLNVGNGRLYVDFTGRNLFNNNQLVAGYRFSF